MAIPADSSSRLHIVGVLTGCLVAVSGARGGELFLWLVDPLTSSEPVRGEARKEVTGGSFGPVGWKSTSASSQIVITLREGYGPREAGALELVLAGLDPVNQYSGKKHQFFNLYSWPAGSKETWELPTRSWWNIRGGNNYRSGGGAGFKMLWAPRGVESRGEVRLIQTRSDWSPSTTYTLRVEWTAKQVWLDLIENHAGKRLAKRLTGPHEFSGRTDELKYVFLGRDNVYPGFVGPVYKCLRAYRPLVGPRAAFTPALPTDRASEDLKVIAASMSEGFVGTGLLALEKLVETGGDEGDVGLAVEYLTRTKGWIQERRKVVEASIRAGDALAAFRQARAVHKALMGGGDTKRTFSCPQAAEFGELVKRAGRSKDFRVGREFVLLERKLSTAPEAHRNAAFTRFAEKYPESYYARQAWMLVK